ncbi:signal recognition particle, SRP9/SRP14 subunit [Acaromyces ingoldii]|uniref:Signal recognition particle subunit SRP14 n=1 Tax=Acaromyces ingoldii TaxID=215250 RepID=A0A316YQC2_9BASI|nr:signal recognition particle, SRP9/SRP14 subunit [Acaromyces ingoldii]PWN91740.1 signal recognition particle, SRP9/SRP14 subunit [Acaromyces ingoldii]
MSGRVSNEEFLAKLQSLFESCASSHSLYLSQKRATKAAVSGKSAAAAATTTWPVIFRATDGKGRGAAERSTRRTKFSTLVEADALAAFQQAYTALLRTRMAGFLKKRDKAKERRTDKALKEQRKRLEDFASKAKVSQIGSKRGAGRRKRQNAQKRAAKARMERMRLAKATKAAPQGSGSAAAPKA